MPILKNKNLLNFMIKRIILVLICSLSFYNLSLAQSVSFYPTDSFALKESREKMAEIRKVRPTVGLVLSGGGAKGMAHIGAIKYIESLGIPIDLVVGTSIGGLVGGVYAVGYNAVQMDSIVRGLNWTHIMSDYMPREYKSYNEVKYNEEYLLSFPFFYDKDDFIQTQKEYLKYSKNKTLNLNSDNQTTSTFLIDNLLGSLPSGYIYGQNIGNTFSGLTVGYQDSISFNNLKIPFACVATDLVTGKGYVWHRGKLLTALRSTISIPGVFAPVKTNGMVLVDGGMRDNYPAELAKDMGADIIIGIDLAENSKDYTEINNIGGIISAGVDMLARSSYEKNVNIPDVKISPELSDYNIMSFDDESLGGILERGWDAALAQEEELRKIKALMPSISHKKENDILDFARDSILVTQISIEGVDVDESKILLKKINFQPKNKLTKLDVEHIVSLIYSTQAFDYVTYELLGATEPFHLAIKCKKGPIHKVGLGVRFDTEEIVSLKLNLGFNTQKLNGSKVNINTKISSNPQFQIHYAYDSPEITTLNLSAKVRWADVNLLDMTNNRTEFSYLGANVEAYLSNLNWFYLKIKLGLKNDYFDIRSIMSSNNDLYGSYDESKLRNNYLSLFFDAKNDTFDNSYFPTRGYNLSLAYSWTFTGFPTLINNFHTAQFGVKTVISTGNKFAILPSLLVRYNFGNDAPIAFANAIGGDIPGRYLEQQIPFVGVSNIWIMNSFLSMVRLDLRYEVSNNHYLTGILNYARDSDGVNEDLLVGMGWLGAGLEYSYDAFFGPIKFQTSWSNIYNKMNFYVGVGYYF